MDFIIEHYNLENVCLMVTNVHVNAARYILCSEMSMTNS
jgi:hypothetical protein